MKTTDLRIGNLIEVEGFNPKTIETAKVISISEHEINCEDKRGSTLITSEGLRLKEYGIPLTPEWLERFGFDYVGDNLYEHSKYDLFQVQIEGIEFAHIWDASYTAAPLEYVHQLQNLFFSLNGEELELKQ